MADLLPMALIALDFEENKREALLRGLAKGMGAPLMLFAANHAKAEVVPMPKLVPAPQVRVPVALTVLTDMQRIGLDFNAAVSRYEQANPKPASVSLQSS